MNMNAMHDIIISAGEKTGWPARAILVTKHDGVDELMYSLVEWTGRLKDKMVTIVSSTNLDEVQALLDIYNGRSKQDGV